MRTYKWSKLHIILLAILLVMAVPVFAENEEPLILTVEADPECLLSQAGEMTFFRFTLKNTLDEDYVLEDLTLEGDLLTDSKLISESLTIQANDVQEFLLEKVTIDEDQFDTDLTFRLTWRTTAYAPEDVEHLEPIVSAHSLSVPIHIERFIEPVMTLSCQPDVLLAREGGSITVTYTLINDTKFDMTNITLQDEGIPQPSIPLEKNTLNAGERMQAQVTFSMGSSDVELNPSTQYTVRGIESKASAAETVTVENVAVTFFMEVEKYPATAEGTLFRIRLINDGTHPMTDIRLVDEIGTLIADGITVAAGAERIVSCTVPSAVSSGSVRYISFEATGRDSIGDTVTIKSPSAYEVLPFVDSDQVRLNLSVTLSRTAQNDDGSNRLMLLFDIRNDSLVPIKNAVITEADYFKGIVNEYAALSTGTTTFEKEFVVPAGTRSLTFVLTAMDPAQTQYASSPMTLDLSSLTVPKATIAPAIKPGKTVDITGTIYDTERYIRILRMTALIVLALTLVFLLLSLIFHVAELNIRRWLPKEPVVRPFGPRKTPTGPIQVRPSTDPVHDQFGYLQPAKLRYMDRTDRIPVVGQEQPDHDPFKPVQALTNTGINTLTVKQNGTPAPRREGDITAVPIHKPRTRPVMISSDNTMPFAPVHEEQLSETKSEAAVEEPPKTVQEGGMSAVPRVIEVRRAPRIVPRKKLEIVHIHPV